MPPRSSDPTRPAAGRAGLVSRDRSDAARGVAPIGIVLLIALTVLLAGGVVASLSASVNPAEPAPTAALSLAVEDGQVRVAHRGGDHLDVAAVRLRVAVDGEPLTHQPPVPFFSAAGFRPGPTGAFNSAGETTLYPGESASFRIAGTNEPTPEPGTTVRVRVHVGDRPVASLTATAR